MPHRAVIFDMDGLMLDTERVGMLALQQAAAEHGFVIPDTLFIQTIGRTGKDAQAIYRDALGPDFPYVDIQPKRQAYSQTYYDQHGMPTKPGLHTLLTWLEARAIPKAVVTSTTHSRALIKLRAAAVAHRFSTVIGGDDVTHGKPSPEPFLIAAEQLQLPPAECLVLEDSAPGIIAAHRAGMQPIWIPDLQTPSDEVRPLAYCVCDSLQDAIDVLATCLA